VRRALACLLLAFGLLAERSDAQEPRLDRRRELVPRLVHVEADALEVKVNG
jgi:hypothetical protein